VHRIGLKSKSHGKGSARFQVITKPSGFQRISEEQFLKAEKQVRRTEFLRADVRHDHPKVAPRAGEFVGQGFEEMSTMKGTKAKAMMERMGWSPGEGLGSESNKGRTEPIQHFIRYSKVGLG
jgi:hypothetical protein